MPHWFTDREPGAGGGQSRHAHPLALRLVTVVTGCFSCVNFQGVVADCCLLEPASEVGSNFAGRSRWLPAAEHGSSFCRSYFFQLPSWTELEEGFFKQPLEYSLLQKWPAVIELTTHSYYKQACLLQLPCFYDPHIPGFRRPFFAPTTAGRIGVRCGVAIASQIHSL